MRRGGRCAGGWTPPPLPLQPGENGDVDSELSEVQIPHSSVAVGRGQGHQHRQRAAGSWASLPSPAAPANSSLCLHWGGGIGASLPGDLGVPKFFVSPNSSTPSRGRERFGVWLRVDVWQEGCRSCRGDQLCITFCFAPAEGDTPLPPIPPEVMASLGRGTCGFGMKQGCSAPGVLLPVVPRAVPGAEFGCDDPKVCLLLHDMPLR